MQTGIRRHHPLDEDMWTSPHWRLMWSRQHRGEVKGHRNQQCLPGSRRRTIDRPAEESLSWNRRHPRLRRQRRGENDQIDRTDLEGHRESTGLTETAPGRGGVPEMMIETRLVRMMQEKPWFHSLQQARLLASATGLTWLEAGM